MKTMLYRFKKKFEKNKDSDLRDFYVKDVIDEYVESTGIEADLSEVEDAFDNYITESIKKKWYSKKSRDKLDGEHTEVVHKALRHLPRELTCDIRFWQWLSLVKFRRYTIFRWCSITAKIELAKNIDSHKNITLIEQESQIPQAFLNHLVGGTTMKSITNLHSISRLFWLAEYLYTKDDGYRLAKFAYSFQDIATSLTQRRYAQHYIIAQTFVAKLEREKNTLGGLKGGLKVPVQRAARKLSLAFGTINSDYLDKKDLEELINFN